MNTLTWNETDGVRFGEGISRTSAEKAKLFELMIQLPHQRPMRDLVRAESLEQALDFAKNRYPNCTVVVPPAVKRPKLSKSSNGPIAEAKRRKKLAEKHSEPAS